MREMDGNLMWQYRDFEDRGYDPRHHYFSAVVEGMPRFDYSYEALAEAVERTNTGGKARRRSELPIVRPTQEEYLELLRFREEEVERVLALADKHDGSIHTKEAELEVAGSMGADYLERARIPRRQEPWHSGGVGTRAASREVRNPTLHESLG